MNRMTTTKNYNKWMPTDKGEIVGRETGGRGRARETTEATNGATNPTTTTTRFLKKKLHNNSVDRFQVESRKNASSKCWLDAIWRRRNNRPRQFVMSIQVFMWYAIGNQRDQSTQSTNCQCARYLRIYKIVACCFFFLHFPLLFEGIEHNRCY